MQHECANDVVKVGMRQCDNMQVMKSFQTPSCDFISDLWCTNFRLLFMEKAAAASNTRF